MYVIYKLYLNVDFLDLKLCCLGSKTLFSDEMISMKTSFQKCTKLHQVRNRSVVFNIIFVAFLNICVT